MDSVSLNSSSFAKKRKKFNAVVQGITIPLGSLSLKQSQIERKENATISAAGSKPRVVKITTKAMRKLANPSR